MNRYQIGTLLFLCIKFHYVIGVSIMQISFRRNICNAEIRLSAWVINLLVGDKKNEHTHNTVFSLL